VYVTSKPTHRQLSNTNSLPSVHFLDFVIDESSSERLLGVTINNDLSWNTHVENVIKNVIHFFIYCLELKFSVFQNRKRFYNAYILPHFIFVVLFGGNCYTSVMEDKLVKKRLEHP